MATVGSLDRHLRVIFAVALLVGSFLPPFAAFFAAWGWWKLAVPAVGVVLLGTAQFRFCPAYTLLGIRTCPISKA